MRTVLAHWNDPDPLLQRTPEGARVNQVPLLAVQKAAWLHTSSVGAAVGRDIQSKREQPSTNSHEDHHG